MKKLLLLCSVALVSFISSNAQTTSEGFHFEGGVRLGLPVGNFKQLSSFGVGLELQGEYVFSPMISATINSGYTSFFGKTITFQDGLGNSYSAKVSNVGYIPLMAGIRVYPAEQFFIGARAGIGFLSGGGSGNAFNYEPQVGYNAEKIQVAIGYNSLSPSGGGSLAHISLTAMYKFN